VPLTPEMSTYVQVYVQHPFGRENSPIYSVDLAQELAYREWYKESISQYGLDQQPPQSTSAPMFNAAASFGPVVPPIVGLMPPYMPLTIPPVMPG